MGRPTRGSVTRSDVPSPEERLEVVVGMMERNEWRRGESAPVLARRWGLSANAVERTAAEASRLVRRAIQNVDEVKTDVAVLLMGDLRRASEQCKFGAEARLADVLTRILGARAPERHEVTMTEEQARETWKRLTGKDWEDSDG